MKTKKAIIIIFICLLILPTLSWPIGKLFLNPEVTENKRPAEFPRLTDKFIMDFETYFLENAPYRNASIKLHMETSKFIGSLYYKVLDALNISYYRVKNNVLFGKEDWLFYTNDDSLKDYAGTNLPTQEELDGFLEKAVKIDNYFKSQGKEFIIFLAPNKEQVYSEYMPDGIQVESETKRVEMIADYISQNSDVKIIYCLDDVKQEKGAEQLYFKHDTHWNTLGATYGVNAIFKMLGIDVGEISFTPFESEFRDLANMVAMDVGPDVDYVVDFSLPNGKVEDKKVVLVGDSFAAFMQSPLQKVFSQFFVEGNSSLYEDMAFSVSLIDISDIFILEAVERYDQRIFRQGGMIDQLISYYGL